MRSFAFSLIELLVVIAIIGVLAALAVPTYQKYSIRVKINSLEALAKNVGDQVQNYYVRTGNWPQGSDLGTFSMTGTNVNSPTTFSPYLLQFSILNNTGATGCSGSNPTSRLVFYISGSSVNATFHGNATVGGTTNWVALTYQWFTANGGGTFQSTCGYINSANAAADSPYLPEACQNNDLTAFTPTCT